jgi:hypothetical protein
MKRVLITILVAAACAAVTAITVSQAAPAPGRAQKSARATHRGINDRFSVLRSAKPASSSGVGLPASTTKHLTNPGTLVSEFELEPANAASVQVNSTHVWVIPGRRGMCLAVPEVLVIAEVCGTITNADAGGLIMEQWPKSGPAVVYGLVPDGAAVIVTDVDGSRNIVPVTSNVFSYPDSAAQSVSVQPVGQPAMTTDVNQSAH